jgi:hypothetical protein
VGNLNPFSVTRRYIEFLFSHEETAMSDLEREFKEAIIESWYVFGRAKDVTHGADMAWDATRHLFDGFELQLPDTDDDKTGQDVE